MESGKKAKKLAGVGSALALGVAMVPVAQADGAGAFIGGMVTAKVINNMERRTEAEEDYYDSQSQRQSYSQPAPAPSRDESVEDRLAKLDQLAANGYISKEEYQRRRQAILDDI